MESNSTKKKPRGSRKIEMKKIESKKNLHAAFTKRRDGLFKKAGELVVLCGSEIAILVQSPGNKIFAFGHPSVQSVIAKFETAGAYSPLQPQGHITGMENAYLEAAARLEEQKKIVSVSKEIATGTNGKFWWDEEIEGMELQELEEYGEALEKLLERVKEMEVAKESERLPLPSDSVVLPSQNMRLSFGAFGNQINYFMISEQNDAQEEEIVQDVWHFVEDLWCWKQS